MRADDAAKAVSEGYDGILVSNHGGRQVDGGIGALDALPGVVAAVKGKVPVLFDSGVRCGADVFKALALGAKAVCIGRPYVYGLALAGEAWRAGGAGVPRWPSSTSPWRSAGCRSVAAIGTRNAR